MQAMCGEIGGRGVECASSPCVKVEKVLPDVVSSGSQNQLLERQGTDSKVKFDVELLDHSISGTLKGPEDSQECSVLDEGSGGHTINSPNVSENDLTISLSETPSVTMSTNALGVAGAGGSLGTTTIPDIKQSPSLDGEPNRRDGNVRDCKESITKKSVSSGIASVTPSAGRENSHQRRGDRNTEWHPLDATVERIESCLRPGSSGVKYQWCKGFRMPLGAEGRQILLRRLRKAYHASPCQWDQELARHRIVFSRMPYATVIELFHLAHLLGVFDFAVKCSEEYGGDASGSGGHRRRKGRSQQQQQQAMGQTGGESGSHAPAKFKVNGERKRSRNAAASDGTPGETQPPVSRPKRMQRAAPAYLKDYENIVESSYTASGATSRAGVVRGSSLRCSDGRDAATPGGSGRRFLGGNRGVPSLQYGSRLFDTNSPQPCVGAESTFDGAVYNFGAAVNGNSNVEAYNANCLIPQEDDAGIFGETGQTDLEKACSSLDRSTFLTNALLTNECFNNQPIKHLQNADRGAIGSFGSTQENFGSSTLNGLSQGLDSTGVESIFPDHLKPSKVGCLYALEDSGKISVRGNSHALKEDSITRDTPGESAGSALTGGVLPGEADLNLHLLTTNYTITAQYLQAIELLAVQKQIVDLIQSLTKGSDGEKQSQVLLSKSTDISTCADQVDLLQLGKCSSVGDLTESVEIEVQGSSKNGRGSQQGILNSSEKVLRMGTILEQCVPEKFEGMQAVSDAGNSSANRELECLGQREDLRRQSSFSYCTSDSPIRDGEDAVSVCMHGVDIPDHACKPTEISYERKPNLLV